VGDQAAERMYYDEPSRMEFTATVTAIREVARVDGKQVWQIALDRTAFYPTSGGQPYDTGVLTAIARSGAKLHVPITAVDEDESGEVWHTTAKPLQEGTEVTGTVDAARRVNHMQQHSGQHLLSALLARECGALTVSFHLGEVTSTIDLDVASLTEEQLAASERSANQVIAASLSFAIRTVSQDEAQGMLAAGLLRKLPPREGSIRLIEIPGIDLNACGGTHVATTAEIGPVLLRGTERVRGGVRLAFVCGERALEAAANDFRLLTELGQSLSTAPAEIGASIARLQADAKAAAKERAALLASLAELEAKQLAAQADGKVVIHTLDALQPGRDAAYAKLLASRLATSGAVLATLIIAPEPERASVVLAARPGTLDCGTLLRNTLADFNGRGGGNREMAQGALSLAALDAWLAAIRTQLHVLNLV
jgi:alanyl-tRNA synthetase